MRQIVPEDFTHLSRADQQLAAALEGVLKKLFGLDAGVAIVVRGMTTTWGGGENISARWSTLTIGEGAVLWNGLLWEFGGAELQNTSITTAGGDWKLVMEKVTTAPSPVYGESIELDVSPHKVCRCRVAPADEEVVSADGEVLLRNVRILPTMGETVGIGSMQRQEQA